MGTPQRMNSVKATDRKDVESEGIDHAALLLRRRFFEIDHLVRR